MRIDLTVNGDKVGADVEPRDLLVDFLREGMGLTGTKIGCETSVCGACTVLLDGIAVKSCTVLAVQAHGGEVTTIEGLAPKDGLSLVQEAFRREHGLQCGFCTPGMVVTTTWLLRQNPDPDDPAIRQGLDGNFCRCTGYTGILRAVRYAAALMRGEEPIPEAGRSMERPLARTEVQAADITGDDVEVV